MKKLIFLIMLIIVPLAFFSFLAKTDITTETHLSLFYDYNLPNHSVIVGDLTEKLRRFGYRVSIEIFDADKLNSFIMAHPDALFVTPRELDSDLFVLKSMDYRLVKVPVTNLHGDISDISSDHFNELVTKSVQTDIDVSRKIAKNRMQCGVISFQNLNLNLKPIAVEGVFPSLHNIMSGKYGRTYEAYIYARHTNTLLEKEEFRKSCGGWINETLSFIAGGDVMLSRGATRFLIRNGPRYPFLEIHTEIAKHDIAFANLESPISERGTRFFPNKGIYFRADPMVIEGLDYCGFDAFSLGNNHSLDYGIDALEDTIEVLRESNLQHSGVGKTRQEALKPATFSINNISIAIIAINDIYPFEYIDQTGNVMKTLTYDTHHLKGEIAVLKAKYDILIASFHTGIEYVHEPEAVKVEKMRNLIDWGVDIVLGSHPHVIQGIEVYKGRLIAYSLGNLIFDQNWSKETSLGLLLEIAFLKDKPLYYWPRVVYIEKAQARIIENDESEKILSSLYLESKAYEYVKN